MAPSRIADEPGLGRVEVFSLDPTPAILEAVHLLGRGRSFRTLDRKHYVSAKAVRSHATSSGILLAQPAHRLIEGSERGVLVQMVMTAWAAVIPGSRFIRRTG